MLVFFYFIFSHLLYFTQFKVLISIARTIAFLCNHFSFKQTNICGNCRAIFLYFNQEKDVFVFGFSVCLSCSHLHFICRQQSMFCFSISSVSVHTCVSICSSRVCVCVCMRCVFARRHNSSCGTM